MLTRRKLLQLAAASPALSAAGSPALLSVFDYAQVELLDSPLRRQFDKNHTFFLNLSEDRLLKIYRQRAGLPAPGEDMGGWYDDFCPGAHFGQYVSGLARFAAATGSQSTRAKVQRLVKGYSETVDPNGPGAGGKFFAGLRYPGYTYDKLVCGLLDAHAWAGDPAALPVLNSNSDRIPMRPSPGTRLTPWPRTCSSPMTAPAIACSSTWASATFSTAPSS